MAVRWQVSGMCQACVRNVVLCGSETRTVKKEDLAKLERNDMMMVQWMCYVTLKDKKSSEELREHLGLVSIRNCIQMWFGHLERISKAN